MDGRVTGLLSEALGSYAESRAVELRQTFDRDLAEMDRQQLGDYFLETLHALADEVFEVGKELGWKPWVSPEARGVVKLDGFVEEVADVVIFLGNLLAAAAAAAYTTPEAIGGLVAAATQRKTETNRERRATGYRGRT